MLLPIFFHRKRRYISTNYHRSYSGGLGGRSYHSGGRRHGTGCGMPLILLLLLAVAAWLLWVFYPLTENETADSDLRVMSSSRYVVLADSAEVFAFSETRADSLLSGITDARGGFVTDTVNAQWVKRWKLLPYCGDAFAVEPYDTAEVARMNAAQVKDLLSRELKHLCMMQDVYKQQREDIDYYLKTHRVTDNGFDLVMRYSKGLNHYNDSVCKAAALVRKALKAKKLTVRFERNFSFNDSTQQRRFSRLDAEAAQQRLKARQAMKPVVHHSAIDSLGTYTGERDSLARPHGYGRFFSLKGVYYEGEWSHGKLQGVGLSMEPGQRLRLGEWKDNKYLGERITHRSDRVYGIDISRYQHEQGRKRFSINWKNLRITSLGHASKKDIEGTVDYPVRFVYIKATEGVTLKNKYFLADYAASKKTGHRTGAYHFFTLKTLGSLQAKNFLKNARYKAGDLPPVLDLEPTDRQIREAGGVDRMFTNVRKWLRMVEETWHVRPVLYISQRFVNKYLPLAPDLKKGYDVWIARYGEYKPDVNLLYWQLGQDGRVAGIHGDVDINVYNGFDF